MSTEPVSPIASTISRMENRLARAGSALGDLHIKLAIICKEPTEPGAMPRPEPDGSSSITHTLDNFGSQIDDLVYGIEDLLARLEI